MSVHAYRTEEVTGSKGRKGANGVEGGIGVEGVNGDGSRVGVGNGDVDVDGNGNGAGADTETRAVAETGTGAGTETVLRTGPGRAEESGRCARNRTLVVDVMWETGDKKGPVQ